MSFDALLSTSICYGAPEADWTLALPITLPLTTLLLLYAIGAIRLWHRSANSRRCGCDMRSCSPLAGQFWH